MSKIRTYAKQAFPFAMIALLSGLYSWSMGPPRPANTSFPTPIDPDTSVAELRQLPDDTQVRDLPRSERDLETAETPFPHIPAIQTTAGSFQQSERPQLDWLDHAPGTTENVTANDVGLANDPSPIGLQSVVEPESGSQPVPFSSRRGAGSTAALSSVTKSAGEDARFVPALNLQSRSEPRLPEAPSADQSVPTQVGSHRGKIVGNPYLKSPQSQSPADTTGPAITAATRSQETGSTMGIRIESPDGAARDTGPLISSSPRVPEITRDYPDAGAPRRTSPQPTMAFEDSFGAMDRRNESGPVQSGPVQSGPTPSPRGVSAVAKPDAQLAPLQLSSAVRSQIRHHLDYGNSLARRSATRLAKEEFTKGLRIISEASDNQYGAATHMTALQQGFQAMREAEDFDSAEGVLEWNPHRIAETHDTPMIRQKHYQPNTPSQARRAYLIYAQDRIVQAVDKDPIASELLYALAKIHLVDAMYASPGQPLDYARAAVLFQCSLIINPEHVRSANELGVILARSGQWNDAKVLFQNAVRVDAGFAEAWRNLEKAHRELGETHFAELAHQEGQKATQGQIQPVQLLEAGQFDAANGAWGIPQATTSQASHTTPGNNPSPAHLRNTGRATQGPAGPGSFGGF